MKKISLTQGKYALVDDNDYAKLSKFHWFFIRRKHGGYAMRNHSIFMHREIMGFPRGKMIDHINRNGLDNRKKNLRLADNSLNQVNSRKQVGTTSRFKGVTLHPNGKWQVYFRGKYLGLYKSERAAARCYQLAGGIL